MCCLFLFEPRAQAPCRSAPGCTQGGTRTWGDCWRCYYPNFVKRHCEASPPEVREAFRGCSPPSLPTTHVAYYAAQLAWWLAFFPPERFLILTSSELHSREQQLQVRPACRALVRGQTRPPLLDAFEVQLLPHMTFAERSGH